MRGLKALVIGMGVLIVVGLVVLVVAAVDQAGNGGFGGDETPEAFVPRSVTLPEGAEIAETRIGDGRIVLRLRLADGNGQLMILDANTGRPVGIVDLKSE